MQSGFSNLPARRMSLLVDPPMAQCALSMCSCGPSADQPGGFREFDAPMDTTLRRQVVANFERAPSGYTCKCLLFLCNWHASFFFATGLSPSCNWPVSFLILIVLLSIAMLFGPLELPFSLPHRWCLAKTLSTATNTLSCTPADGRCTVWSQSESLYTPVLKSTSSHPLTFAPWISSSGLSPTI